MASLDESQYQLNAKVITDLLNQNMIALNQGMLIDHQDHRRRTNMIAEAGTVKGLELLFTVDPSEARGLRSLGSSESIDSTAVGGILATMIQQASKIAQSTRPETGAG